MHAHGRNAHKTLPCLLAHPSQEDEAGKKLGGAQKKVGALEANLAGMHAKRDRRPGLEIVFEVFTEAVDQHRLGKLIEEKIYVNINHSAWARA